MKLWGWKIYEGVKIDVEDWFGPVLNIHTPFSPPVVTLICLAPLQLSSQKKTILR
jgi:hypothetical protein